MTLRKRLLSLAAGLVFLPAIIVVLLCEYLLLKRFDLNDSRHLESEAQRLGFAIDDHLTRSLGVLRNAAWSERAYRFAQGQGRDGFIQSELNSNSVTDRGFDFLVYFDNEGRILGEHWVNSPAQSSEMPPLENLRRDILKRSCKLGLLHAQARPVHGSAQVLMSEGIPVVLLSTTISDEKGSAPPVGNAIAGRFLGPQHMALLRRFVNGELSITPAQRLTDNDQWQPLTDAETLQPSILIGTLQRTHDNQHQTNLLFRNNQGDSELALQIRQPRWFYEEGHRTVHVFLALMTGICALVLGAMYLGLGRLVLLPVQRLQHQVSRVGKDSSQSRLNVQSRDELGLLADEINGMIKRIASNKCRDQAVLDGIAEGYLELDRDGKILSANRTLKAMLGYAHDALQGCKLADLVVEERAQHISEKIQQALSDTHAFVLQAQLKHSNGHLLPCELRLSSARNADGETIGLHGMVHDISTHVAYQQQLLDMAYRDALTGLGNRKAFLEQLQQRLARADRNTGSVALLFLDLDRFKQVNDQYGHDVGDRLLEIVAKRIGDTLRQPDQAFRLGGDEFTVIVDADSDQALALAGRLRDCLSKPYSLNGVKIDFISTSIGIALYPQHADTPEALIKAADEAMYIAKRQRNRFFLCASNASTSPA